MDDTTTAPVSRADLRGRLEASLRDSTPATQALAAYFLSHLKDLPFDTAATVAVKTGLSEATVGRFCRALGYRNFKEVKAAIQADLGGKAWLIGERLQDLAKRLKSGSEEVMRGMQREFAAIAANYETAATPEFARAVTRLARCPQVFVAGFQTERGHGQFLSHGLQYLRPGVQLLDQSAGHFAEAILAAPDEACLVLIDGRRCSRLTRTLAMQARGMVPNYEASVVKIFQSELGQKIYNFGVNMLGLSGQMMPEEPRAPMHGALPESHLMAVPSTIYSGSNEIQRNLIATRTLGLPAAGSKR